MVEHVGHVIEIPSKSKAIIQFKLGNSIERALLCNHNLCDQGKPMRHSHSISYYLRLGTVLNFVCHSYDETKKYKCRWFVVSAWRELDIKPVLERSLRRFHGMHNAEGIISQVTKREGYLVGTDEFGSKDLVAFQAIHVYRSSGKRVCEKTSLHKLYDFRPGEAVMFDAVPCDPEDNENGCRWFATAVWKGVKPSFEYDKPPPDPRICPPRQVDYTQPSEMKLLTSNPLSLFLCGPGKITKILNAEFAIARCELCPKTPQFILFHRSVVVLFEYCVVNADLNTMFKEGDSIRFCAAVVPIERQYVAGVQWIASRVTISTDPSE